VREEHDERTAFFSLREKRTHLPSRGNEEQYWGRRSSLSGNAQKRKKEREEAIEKRLWRKWSG
jgi:hypothetical protein